MRRQRRDHILQKNMFLRRIDVFEHVERIGTIVAARHGSGQHVMGEDIESPSRIHPLLDVFDKERIEIGRRQLLHFLADDAGAEGVGAADLEDMLAARQQPTRICSATA